MIEAPVTGVDTATATLMIHICRERRSYLATFSTQEQAIAFLGARTATHAWEELEGGSVPPTWTDLLEYLYPGCEHGMSLSLCEGPNHYLTADEEHARGW